MQKFLEFISPELKLVEKNIYNQIKKYSPEVVEKIAENLLLSGGKRIRPALVILSASAIDRDSASSEDVINLATIVEIVHMASLIHDDVIDESEIRRNRPTSHKLWGNKLAILSGDYLLSIGFNILSDVVKKRKDATILKIFANTMQQMCKGVIQEITDSKEFSKTKYLNLIKRKTAYLFSTCCYVGAKCANGTISQINALSLYGMNFGISFQIVDDMLDFISLPEKFGKPTFSDVNSFKITLPIINLLEVANRDEKVFVKNYFRNKENKKEIVEKIIEIMNKYRIFKKTKEEAKKYLKEAKKSIEILPPNKSKSILEKLLWEFLERKV
jgi:geranylgeranyl pyrophosphate synthase